MSNYKKEILLREQDLKRIEMLDNHSIGQVIREVIRSRVYNEDLEATGNSLIDFSINSLIISIDVNDNLYEKRVEDRKNYYKEKKKSKLIKENK